MSKKQVQVQVVLPNGKQHSFTIEPGTRWKDRLTAELKEHYPRTHEIRFVEDIPPRPPAAGRSYRSNVMFEIRKNYYLLGHVAAHTPEP